MGENENSMAYDKKGKVPKVKDRWYGDHKYRQGRDFNPREFKGDPQFKLDNLYITPFTHQRRYSEDGRVSYVPIERNLKPTGIRIMDDFLRSLTTGHAYVAAFCKRYGARTSDIDSIIFLFTGMRGVDFRQAYQLRLADDLLRYTSLPVADVAKRSGFGSRINLYFSYQRDLKTTPSNRREKLREQGDKDMYKIE